MYTLIQRKKESKDYSSAGGFFLLKAEQYLFPFMEQLDVCLDKRLVRTFFDLFASILRFRNRSFGLILSELGAFVLSPSQACAGTKRISNLLRSQKWSHDLIEQFLLKRAQDHLQALRQKKQQVLLLWDDSVVEKPESWFSEGLCSVASSKAKRLTRIKPGYYRPPRSRICVPGFEWTSVIMTTLTAVPCLVTMRWWSTRGKYLTDRKSQFLQLFKQLRRHFDQPLIHVMDRGYADASILTRFVTGKHCFIVRWVKTFNLRDVEGKLQNAQKYAQKPQNQSSKVIWDAARKRNRRVKLSYQIVFLPQHDQHAMYLIVCQDSKHGQQPMYLLSNCPVNNKRQAWTILFHYMRRWNIEQTFRFTKSELALESPRLWKWENRLKLLMIVALVYEFLLRFLRNWNTMARKFIRRWCPRTGKRHLEVQVPLYRLRIAIVAMLNEFVAQNSG